MTAQEILKMIEAVSPDDTAKLDEIDARVWCYLIDATFKGMAEDFGENKYFIWSPNFSGTDATSNLPNRYTRSRDALKAARPDGFTFVVQEVFGQYESWDAVAKKYNSPVALHAQGIDTEELAELHAIIQAIEYERSNK